MTTAARKQRHRPWTRWFPKLAKRRRTDSSLLGPAIECLENRTLLSGVTIITHGFQPTPAYPEWAGPAHTNLLSR